MAIVTSRNTRVFIDDTDISGIVRAIEINGAVDDVMTVHLELITAPETTRQTDGNYHIRIDSHGRTRLGEPRVDGNPVRAIKVRANED